jgi:hypothetical protein
MLREGPIMGDLRQQTFAEVWAGANYAALRARRTLPLFPACRHCDDFLDENRQLLAALPHPPTHPSAGSKPAEGSKPVAG